VHRHDTYAIGRTLAGVQSFSYRHSQRHSLPGNTIVLHPDEAHDGQAGTDEGFKYRMIYVEPALFQDVLGGRALPFLEGGVTTDPRLAAATTTLLQHVGYTLDSLEQSDALIELAHALAAVAGTPARRSKGNFFAARRARDSASMSYRPVKLSARTTTKIPTRSGSWSSRARRPFGIPAARSSSSRGISSSSRPGPPEHISCATPASHPRESRCSPRWARRPAPLSIRTAT